MQKLVIEPVSWIVFNVFNKIHNWLQGGDQSARLLYCDLSLKKYCRQMKSQSFVWKSLSGNLWFRRKKLNLQFRRISSLRNSCKTCSSGSKEERSQPNYGFNAARITKRPKSFHIFSLLFRQTMKSVRRVQNHNPKLKYKMVLWWYFVVIFNYQFWSHSRSLLCLGPILGSQSFKQSYLKVEAE